MDKTVEKKIGQRFKIKICPIHSESHLIYFPREQSRQMRNKIDQIIANMINYAQSYFNNWHEKAYTRFISNTQIDELEPFLQSVFWEWFILDFRLYPDASAILGFYLAEHEEVMEEKDKEICEALSNSNLSIYRVLSNNHSVIVVEDIFNYKQKILSKTTLPVKHIKYIKDGAILFARISNINNENFIIGTSSFIPEVQHSLLYEKVLELRKINALAEVQVLKEKAELLCGIIIDLHQGKEKKKESYLAKILSEDEESHGEINDYLVSDYSQKVEQNKVQKTILSINGIINNFINLKKLRAHGNLNQESIKNKVQKHRLRQELSPFVSDYTWEHENYNLIAIKLFDSYEQSESSYLRLSYLLYMWNEFTLIHKPSISKQSKWIKILEYIYNEIFIEKNNSSLDLLSRLQSLFNKKTLLIIKHFKDYPLKGSTISHKKIVEWEETNDIERLNLYEIALKHIYMNVNSNISTKSLRNNANISYFAQINKKTNYWDQSFKNNIESFFEDHLYYDYLFAEGKNLVFAFWEKQARLFPADLKEAILNLMMSHVSVYRVIIINLDKIELEDIFSGKRYILNTYKNEGLIIKFKQDMLILTRALPLKKTISCNRAVFALMSDMEEIFMFKVDVLMEKIQCEDSNNPIYLKKRGEILLQAYFSSLEEIEKTTLELLRNPLVLNWQIAKLNKEIDIEYLLNVGNEFFFLYSDEERKSYIWINKKTQNIMQWGYILLERNCLYITVPPGKDIEQLKNKLKSAVKLSSVILAFRDIAFETNTESLDSHVIIDLVNFFNFHPELSKTLLRQDDILDESIECSQGIFLLRIVSLLIKKNEEDNNSTFAP